MWTTTQIRRHINRLPIGTLFTSRDFLSYGKRGAVDQVLFLMVRAGRIVRMARGVFVKPDTFGARTIMPQEVAQVKAASFDRRIIKDAADAANELGLDVEKNKELTYATDGSSTSFHFGDMVIRFKKVSARKMELGDSQLGQVIRALWHLGSRMLTSQAVETASARLRRHHREELRRSGARMPAWLSDYLLFSISMRVVPASA